MRYSEDIYICYEIISTESDWLYINTACMRLEIHNYRKEKQQQNKSTTVEGRKTHSEPISRTFCWSIKKLILQLSFQYNSIFKVLSLSFPNIHP